MMTVLRISMFIFLITVLVAFILMKIVRWYFFRTRRMRLLQDLNIPGPRPHFIFGHMKEYNSTPNVIWDSEMIDKYGPICGYYIGAKPVILIADPNLANQIRNFEERPRRVPGGINPDPMRAKMLGNLSVEKWKRLRAILNKSFSSNMIKSFTPTVARIVDQELMDAIRAQHSAEVNIYPLLQNFTFELISQTGFGVHANFSGNSDLRAAVEEEFSKNASNSWLTQLFLCFPDMTILQRIRIWHQWMKIKLGTSKSTELRNFCESVQQERLRSRSRSRDILQVMLDSEIQDDDEKVLANSILFYEAAFETLSAGLAFTIHLLTNNEQAQRIVRDEIRGHLQENEGRICADRISNLKYLDLVIKESLRMYPPQTTFISRSGERDLDYKNEDGQIHTIPKGVHLQICLYQMHHSSKFWDNPEMFRPDRHLDEQKHPDYDVVFQPFGKGKRRCIGYSYAKFVMPFVLATILSQYTFSQSPKTEETIEVLFKTATMTPKNGCFAEINFDPIAF
uniref:Cytochrome P450 CYP3356A1 n=1 Tax=Bradysia odoriphaga TaxID=1564500 RepID=A0A386YIK7_9DIPT|nr:cytochrome P450 CYP3356A1 [Bradysia odoriphaga]